MVRSSCVLPSTLLMVALAYSRAGAPRAGGGPMHPLCTTPLCNSRSDRSTQPRRTPYPYTPFLNLMLVRAYVNASAAADRPGCRRALVGARGLEPGRGDVCGARSGASEGTSESTHSGCSTTRRAACSGRAPPPRAGAQRGVRARLRLDPIWRTAVSSVAREARSGAPEPGARSARAAHARRGQEPRISFQTDD